MNEFANAIAFDLVIRTTLVLVVGWSVVLVVRQRDPSLSILTHRWMLTTLWLIGPAMMVLPALPLGILPATDDVMPLAMQSHTTSAGAITPPSDAAAAATPATDSDVDDQGAIESDETPASPIAGTPTPSSSGPAPIESRRPSSVAVAVADQSQNDNHQSHRPTAGPSALPPRNNDIPSLIATAPTPSRTEVSDAPLAASEEGRAISGIAFWLTTIWAVISAGLAFRLVVRLSRTWKCLSESTPCDSVTASLAREVSDELGLKDQAGIRFCESVRGPCTAGLWRPQVLLPQAWMRSLSRSQQKMVLAHELTHRSGRDPFWDGAAQLTRVIAWFHPLVVGMVNSHRLSCEHRCDEAAVRVTGGASSYRRQLAQWALEFGGVGERGGASDARLSTLSMAEPSLMMGRLRRLKGAVVTPPWSRKRVAATLMIGAFVGILIGAVDPVARASDAPPNDTETTLDAEVADTSPQSSEPPKTPQAESDPESLANHEGDVSPPAETRPEETNARKSGNAETTASPFTPIIWGDSGIQVDLRKATKLPVRVLDDQGAAVVGAEVVLGTITDKRGVSASLPMVGGAISDAKGLALVSIPAGTVKVGLTTTADGFAKDRQDFTAEGTPEIKLQRGRLITVRAVNESGELLKEAFPILQGSRVYGREFKTQDDGTQQSPVVSNDRRWMRVTAIGSEGQLLHSDLIDVHDDSAEDPQGVRVVTLKKGTRLWGRVGESVARPVRSGFVELMIFEEEDHEIDGKGLRWQDTAAILPDGSFEFKSLPAGGHAQLFAMGEGFQTRNPTEEELREYFDRHKAGPISVVEKALARPDILPRLVRLDRPEVEVTLPCRATAGLDVRVIDPAGNPVAGAVGSINPNGYFLGGGLFIPGTEMSTRSMVSGNGGGLTLLAGMFGNKPGEFSSRSFLRVTADEKGIVRFRNVPSRRDSYEVEADGLVMSAHPTSPVTKPWRYALVDLRDGEIAKRTITMERDVPRGTRELTVVYHDGRPLDDIELMITELTTAEGDAEWQQWSVQRWGPLSQGKTDKEGRQVVSHPAEIEGNPVTGLKVFVRGRPERDVAFQGYVRVPTEADGKVIKIVPEDAPRSEGALRTATAEYRPWHDGKAMTAETLLSQVVERPTLVGLRELLALNDYGDSQPLKLLPHRNRMKHGDNPAIVAIETTAGKRVVALAALRPRDAAWTEQPDGRFAPEGAIVFDGKGKLLKVWGGGVSARGSQENITLANLGGTGDCFLRVSAFESHPPHEYYSRWIRVGSEASPSLTLYHYANSTSWSGINGTSTPRSEFGFLGFEFNGQDIDSREPGVTPDGAVVPRRILWDRRKKTFLGPATQSHGGRSLYRVVTDQTGEFEAVPGSRDEIYVMGGRRDFRNWHQWTVTIPSEGEFVARLALVATDSGEVTRAIDTRPLAAGQHNLQLQVAPEGQTETTSRLVVMVDAADLKDKRAFEIPPLSIDDRPSVSGQDVATSTAAPLRLFDKKLVDESTALVWRIERQMPAGD